MDWEGIKDKSWRRIYTRMNSEIKATKDESESQKASKELEAGRTHQKPRNHIREEMQLKRVHWIWSDISSYSGVRTCKRQWEATAKPGCEQPRMQQAPGRLWGMGEARAPPCSPGGEHEHEAELVNCWYVNAGRKLTRSKAPQLKW